VLDDERAAGALQHALDWINHQKHGDNCFLSSHYPSDPGDRCNCGKDSVMQSVETALEAWAASPQWQSHAILRSVAEPAPYLPCPICKGVEGCDHTAPERKLATEKAIYQSRVEGFETAWRDVSKETFDECSAINTFETRIVYPVPQPVAQTERALTDAARDVLTERHRQVTAEGWTPAHDDAHDSEEMAIAAACYAESAGGYNYPSTVPSNWPWASKWWKSTTPRRDLVKAGALILAEIERLDRAAAQPASGANHD
ncbi:hypothetical protein PQR71_42470, partial [Paraburkholderia fungorum]